MPRTAAASSKISPTLQAVRDCADLLSALGASVLAEHINAYWAKRGGQAGAERYEIPGGGGWGVRSKMVGGLPRETAPRPIVYGRSIADQIDQTVAKAMAASKRGTFLR